jgi:hypothetical protein
MKRLYKNGEMMGEFVKIADYRDYTQQTRSSKQFQEDVNETCSLQEFRKKWNQMKFLARWQNFALKFWYFLKNEWNQIFICIAWKSSNSSNINKRLEKNLLLQTIQFRFFTHFRLSDAFWKMNHCEFIARIKT